MNDNVRVTIGIAWYRREEWTLLLATIPDPEAFPPTYEGWSKGASDTLRQLRDSGVNVRKVDVTVKGLLDWAAAVDRPPDGAARAAYAQQMLNEEQHG